MPFPPSASRSRKSSPNAEDESMVATRHLTIEEFEAMPLEGRWELIDGEPVEMTPSSDEPLSIAATITFLLGSFVRPRGLGRLYGAGGGFVIFPDRPTVRVPDVAFVRADRASRRSAQTLSSTSPRPRRRGALLQTAPARWSPNRRCIRRRASRSSGWSIPIRSR